MTEVSQFGFHLSILRTEPFLQIGTRIPVTYNHVTKDSVYRYLLCTVVIGNEK